MMYPFSKRWVIASLFFASLGLVSCEKILRDLATQTSTGNKEKADSVSTAPAEASAPVAKEPVYEITYPAGSKYVGLTPPVGVTPNPFEAVDRIVEAHKENPNWADKHADIKSLFLQNLKKDYLFVLQQQGANEMLRKELFAHYYQDMRNHAVLNAIGFYTEQLVEAKSEDSELIYKCLRALKGHWDDKQIAKVAMTTAKRVQARPIVNQADTTTRNGSYRQIYARELKKMAQRINEGA